MVPRGGECANGVGGRAGGAEGIRTPDLRRAKAALSRLSYGPDEGSLALWGGEGAESR